MNKNITFVIVGRANVGKSTLFNRLVGRKDAIVYDFPGVTRDRKFGVGKIGDLEFNVIDTPGFGDPKTPENYPELVARMQEQTIKAIDEADYILFVIDGVAGCTPFDQEFDRIIRKKNKPTIVLVNKCDCFKKINLDSSIYELALGNVILISSEHGDGIQDIYQEMIPLLLKANNSINVDHDEDEKQESFDDLPQNKPLKLAIVGRPSVGKSTLINAIIDENRLLTGHTPGITRDAITIDWQYKERQITLIDTAGVRRQSKVDNYLEKIAVNSGKKYLKFAEIAILVIDGSASLENLIEKQDLTLARQIIDEGRGLVIAINKTDQVKDKNKLISHIDYQLERHLSQASGVPFVLISAKDKKNLDVLLDRVLEIEEKWNKRISTSILNRWLQAKVSVHQPPIISGIRLKLKYMTQIKSRPPSFSIFANKGSQLPDHYIRYLVNGMREDFDLKGVPIRIFVRTRENPYNK